jgi:CheY-like chemotaxis protein
VEPDDGSACAGGRRRCSTLTAPQNDDAPGLDPHDRPDLLGRASHELRTPLNAILGFAQLLEMDELTEGQERRVQQILKAGRRLLALIDDVLEISRFEAGRLPISLESVDPLPVIHATLDLIRPMAAERDVELVAPPSASRNGYVFADQQRLRYVLLKLVSSAVLRAEGGGSVVPAVVATDGADRVRVAIDAHRPAAVGPESPEAVADTLERELGLGLAERLAGAMEGTLGAEITSDGATRLWIELQHSGDAPRGTRPGPRPPDGTHSATVLYIEDNVVNVELVNELLVGRGDVAMLNAMDGELGLELARQHHPDLVFLDLNLPDMDGETVLRRLKADPTTSAIPVVMLSSEAAPANVERVLEAGALAYLTKPLDLDRFLELVERTLG